MRSTSAVKKHVVSCKLKRKSAEIGVDQSGAFTKGENEMKEYS
jgi:hypothetical protein